MSFLGLVQSMLADTVGPSLTAFRPELTLCITIAALLVVQMIVPRWKTACWYLTMAGLAVAIWLLIPDLWRSAQWYTAHEQPLPATPIFSGMLLIDSFSLFLRTLLILFTLLFTTFVQLSGVPSLDDATEFCVLVLGALLGMCLMVSANHMLIVFLGVEMASVPSYVLAGLLRNHRTSSEASLKYAVYGAGTAGVMLYGISLLAGMLGSVHIPTMAIRFGQLSLAGLGLDQTMVLVLGTLMMAVGLSFKLSAFPFHFWAPDVFEGAPAEVGAFLSIASKAAALGLLVRLALGFSYVPPSAIPTDGVNLAAASASAAADAAGPKLQYISQQRVLAHQTSAAEQQAERLTAALDPARKLLGFLLSLMAVVTCTFGNLAAYGQTNMKRLLAYSTIAHAGYLIMPVAAAVVALGSDPAGARGAVAAMVFYISIYVFMNFGAFAITAFVRNAIGSETIGDYAGMIRRSPGLTVCMAIVLFSLVGLPPLAGFVGKFAIFLSLVQTKMLLLLVIGGLNTVLSLFYYLRVVRVMVLSPEPTDRPAPRVPLWTVPGLYSAVMTMPLLALFIWWDGLFAWAQTAASSLLH